MKLKGKEGEWSLWLAQIAGYAGGLITIAIYMGVTMAGPLGLITQVAGAAGVVAVALAAYSLIKK